MFSRKSSILIMVAIGAFLLAVIIPVAAFMMSAGSSERASITEPAVVEPDGSAQNVQDGKTQTNTGPDVVRMVGPVSQDKNLKDLPRTVTKEREEEEVRLQRYPRPQGRSRVPSDPEQPVRRPSAPTAMPAPTATFAGITSAQSACGCLPPDTDGDVGSGHYIQSVNSRIKITDKSGVQLLAPTTYNSFFSALGASTPCGNNQNDGDGVVFYDHISDRWVVTDFAFGAFPGTSFYECIGVAKTSDPVAGGWWLYAVQTDPGHTNYLGDYPKFGMWRDGYYMAVNLFSNSTTFNGVRVYAFDRASMINGNPANTIAFSILPADLGDKYSLVPASYRTGSAPPVGAAEYVMAINSSAVAGTVENQVAVWRFHADFATPANSTFGVGAGHTPDGTITVNNFVDAFTSAGTAIVPQPGTTRLLDTLGDKLMYPLIYQNRGGTESIYSTHTVNNNQAGTGPTAIRWYQFNVTGGTIPATPTQQETFNNSNDGVWRFMPSINVDRQGNLAIGYAASASTVVEPAIRYAGRLVTDAPGSLVQGEAVMQAGGGHQTSASGRWGDYSGMFVDPADGCSFWHTNEYFSATSASAWNTRIGKFRFGVCAPTAAGVSVSGRVLTADGTGLSHAVVTIADTNGGSRTMQTSSFGYYRFDDVQAGETYTISVASKRYQFTSRLITVTDDLTDVDITAEP